MKSVDAYVGESNQIGSWTLIGYTGPRTKIATQTDSTETTNFLYGGGAYKGSDGKATIGGDAVAAAVDGEMPRKFVFPVREYFGNFCIVEC